MPNYIFNIPDEHYERLKEIKEQSRVSVAEQLRLLIELALVRGHFNDVIPLHSGKLNIGGR